MAAKTSHLRGLISQEQLDRIISIMRRAKLPVHTPDSMTFDDFMTHMMRDKKVLSGQLRLVLPTGIGSAEVIADTPQDIIKQAIDFGRETFNLVMAPWGVILVVY